ncbi:hypothetical protein AEQ27_12185 [Frigoribacterium sp. RIT-PI-h]|nr:hypothetical protein AEQ27_12185 [Frigoribacterium sp. RIT-PI-h]
MPSSRVRGISGYIVMLTVCAPAARNQSDSARGENRGPWITTQVPVGANGTPCASRASIAAARNTGSNGSAAIRCCTWPSTSKNVSRRPQVRSMNWSVTTMVPGATSGLTPPTADDDTTALAPSDASAHTLAR